MRYKDVQDVLLDKETGQLVFFNKRGIVLATMHVSGLNRLWGCIGKYLINKKSKESAKSTNNKQSKE